MTQSKQDLKDEILVELRQDMGGSSSWTQYINMALLVAIGVAGGFLFGRHYERTWRNEVAPHLNATAPRPAQGRAPDGQVPPDHPPLTDVGGGDPMAPVLALRARLEADPNDLEALIGLGNLNYDIGRMEASIDYYQRAIAIDPTNPDVITDMALAQREMGGTDDALRSLELAMSMDATHWQSRLNRAIILIVDQGDQEAALEAFEVYLELGPGVPNYEQVVRQVEELRKQIGARPNPTGGEARLHGPDTPAAPTGGDGTDA